MSDTKFERNAGILMPVSSLPSPYGIGTFGKDAYDFVTFVKECNHKYWQVLPLGPTTYGDSPYQSYSAFAGNPYFVDLDMLIEAGFLLKSEVISRDWGDGIVPVNVSTGHSGAGKELSRLHLWDAAPRGSLAAAFKAYHNYVPIAIAAFLHAHPAAGWACNFFHA